MSNNQKITDIQHLASAQYASADNLSARWDLYNYCVPRMDIYETVIQHLHLKRTESILDVGCGDGSLLLRLRVKEKHAGRLVGLEINDRMFAASKKEQANRHLDPPIEFMVGNAQHLPFHDKSFDVILSFFMLYHMPDISQALFEWKRVLKNEGKLVVATASAGNKPKIKALRKLIEQVLGYAPPPRFSTPFNWENGAEQLSKVFTIQDSYLYVGQLQVDSVEPILATFSSTRDMYDPIPTDQEWERVEERLRRELEKEIAQNGFVTDEIKRGFFICVK